MTSNLLCISRYVNKWKKCTLAFMYNYIFFKPLFKPTTDLNSSVCIYWKYLRIGRLPQLRPVVQGSAVYLKETKTLIQKDICTPMFIAALLTTARIWKQTKCPSTDKWIKKMWCAFAMEYYSAIRKNGVLPFLAMWKDLENIFFSTISQIEKDKYYVISLIYVESKK